MNDEQWREWCWIVAQTESIQLRHLDYRCSLDGHLILALDEELTRLRSERNAERLCARSAEIESLHKEKDAARQEAARLLHETILQAEKIERMQEEIEQLRNRLAAGDANEERRCSEMTWLCSECNVAELAQWRSEPCMARLRLLFQLLGGYEYGLWS